MKELFKKLALSRQSCRDFNDKPLDKTTVEEIASIAMLAPSACNSQPWKMYLVTEKDKVSAVAKSLQDRGHNAFADGAKAFIVISEKDAALKESISARFRSDHFVKYDIGELTAYITLAAESLGVKSCIIGWINQDELRKAVGYPQEEVSNVVVALGYSDCEIRDKKRKEKVEVITVVE